MKKSVVLLMVVGTIFLVFAAIHYQEIFAVKNAVSAPDKFDSSLDSDNISVTHSLQSSAQISTTSLSTEKSNAQSKNIKSIGAVSTKELSDIEIDNLLPTPFNRLLKKKTLKMREKYARFAHSNIPADGDLADEEVLNKLLNSGELAHNFIVDAIRCREGLCELRIIDRESKTPENETNPTLNTIMSGIGKLPQNEFKNLSFDITQDEKSDTYIYFLLSKE